MSPFFCPIFWGTQKRGLLLPKRAAALNGREPSGVRGNRDIRSREAAGRRISLKKCPEK